MNYIKSIVKKNIKLYLFLKKQRIKYSYNDKDFNNLISENFKLIEDLTKKNYFQHSKERYYKLKGTKKNIAAVEINNSCNIGQ